NDKPGSRQARWHVPCSNTPGHGRHDGPHADHSCGTMPAALMTGPHLSTSFLSRSSVLAEPSCSGNAAIFSRYSLVSGSAAILLKYPSSLATTGAGVPTGT